MGRDDNYSIRFEMEKKHYSHSTRTHPSAVSSDPASDVASDEELNDEQNETHEQHVVRTAIDSGDDQSVTEAQQNDHTTPTQHSLTQ